MTHEAMARLVDALCQKHERSPLPWNGELLAELIYEYAPFDPFLADVEAKLAERLIGDKPPATLSEAWIRLHIVFVSSYHRLTDPGAAIARSSIFRADLVQLVATAIRLARDLGIESQSAAIGKDIPF